MSVLKAASIENPTGSKTRTVSDICDGTARAWVNFDATASYSVGDEVNILSSFNVDSVVYDGTGKFTINFSPNTFTNTNYIFTSNVGSPESTTTFISTIQLLMNTSMSTTKTTDLCKVESIHVNSATNRTNFNYSQNYVVFYGGY